MMSERSDRTGYCLAAFGVELLDQGEDVAVVFLEQLLQVLPALGPDAFFRLGDGAHPGEVLVDLVVQIVAVGDDHEGPVAGQLAQHLLGEEDHRIGFAAALGVPEDAQRCALDSLGLRRTAGRDTSKALLTPRYWWFLATSLLQPALRFGEQGEVLDDVQQTRRFADAADDRLQRDDALFALAVDLLPLAEVLPWSWSCCRPGSGCRWTG